MSCVIPLQHIHVGAETSLDVDLLPTEAKQIATDIYPPGAFGNITDLVSVVSGKQTDNCNLRPI
jgi:hypothetical protein